MTTPKAPTREDGLYLKIGETEVTVRCHRHPNYTSQAHPYSATEREVPGAWLVNTIAIHFKVHEGEAPVEEPVRPAATVGVGLDDFGRAVAEKCRWAMDFNQGDPHNKWMTEDQLAVALVLGNAEYLGDMGPGPGYTPETALLLLISAKPQLAPNIDNWISKVRTAIKRPDAARRPELWMPATEPRTSKP